MNRITEIEIIELHQTRTNIQKIQFNKQLIPVNSLRDEVKEEFQMMGSFMTDSKFVGSKGKKLNDLKVEDKIQILINQKKNKTITDEQFNTEMKKLIK